MRDSVFREGDKLKKIISIPLVKSLLGTTMVKVITVFLSFFVSVFFARSLSVDDFGEYNYLVNVITLISLPISAGLPNLIVKYTSEYRVKNEIEKIQGFIFFAFGLSLTISLIFFLILFFVFEYGKFDNTFAFYVLLLSVIISITNILASFLRGYDRILLSQLPIFIIKPGLLFIVVVIIGALGGLNVESALLLNLMASSVALVYAFYEFCKLRINSSKVIYDTKVWLGKALPFLISGSAFFLNSKLDTLMLGGLRENSEVAFYEVASKLGTLMTFFLSINATVLAPKIAELYTVNKYSELKILLFRSVLFASSMALPFFITFFFGGEYIISRSYGIEYVESYVPLIILMFGHLFSCLMGSSGLVLNMTNNQNLAAYGMVLSVIINFTLNFLLIPFWGAIGAAVATSLSLVAWNSILVVMVKIKLGVNTTIFQNPKLC
ncbi:flippase [Persicobacter diffluens]|uniref:Polysaccharide biosynthesis protein C-terminal domain-containing protein n=1 Tax=Persicobacter diffluens TaxID=981 RepID=A0AAN4VYP7_9BACT|nr:hypothetical protein PEDI_20530 [Persicobacter diffluens]